MTGRAPSAAGTVDLEEVRRRYLEHLLRPDARAAWDEIAAALGDGARAAQVYLDVLTPAMVEIGRLIREFHDASAGFVPPADARWQVVIPDPGADLVVHHDLAPWNLIASPTGAYVTRPASPPRRHPAAPAPPPRRARS